MSVARPPWSGGTLEERQQHLALLIHRYVADIETILGRLEDGDFDQLAQLPKVRRELVSCAKQLRDAEIELDQQSTKDALRDGDIDFDAIRTQIGGRLDRLRAAAGAGDVPE